MQEGMATAKINMLVGGNTNSCSNTKSVSDDEVATKCELSARIENDLTLESGLPFPEFNGFHA